MPPRTVRTTQPHNLLDLDDGQFEDLIRDLTRRLKGRWKRLEPVGRLGGDEGRDILGIELYRRKEREWRVQVKRWKEMGPKALRAIVREAVPDPANPPHKLIVAVACGVSSRGFKAFHDEADKLGIAEHEVWPDATINDLLREPKNTDLGAFYFGATRAIDGTTTVPLALWRSAGADLPLMGREGEIAALRAEDGDVLLIGQPGSGKTRLAVEAGDVRFLNLNADADAIADSLRVHRPRALVVDDAGFDIARLQSLLELRRAGHKFAIIGTVWPEHVDAVKRWLPDAAEIAVPLLEPRWIVEILEAMDLSNYYLQADILRQAEGRPGWAIALADLAKRGRAEDVMSGAELVRQIIPYLERMGSSSVPVVGLISLIAVLKEVAMQTLEELDGFLGIDRLERQRLLREAAAAGLLDQRRDSLRVAPDALRSALLRHWFYEQHPPAWTIDEVMRRWPNHRLNVIDALVAASGDGSELARRDLERLLPSVTALNPELLRRYAALDLPAADRVLRDTDAAPDGHLRSEAVIAAARRWAHPQAIRALLNAAIGDERPQHSHPEHPIRVLGEIGSRIYPHRRTGFDARLPILQIATEWFDEDPIGERQLVWARLVTQLLDPAVSGNRADLASPRTIQMEAGFESALRMDALRERLWPMIEARLHLLDSRSLFLLTELVDQWVRVSRGISGGFGALPNEEQQAAADRFLDLILLAMVTTCEARPAAQLAMRRTAQMFHLRMRQNIDPEFRILSWEPWRLPQRGKNHALRRAAEGLAERWANEPPEHLMARLRRWYDEAGDRNPFPMMWTVTDALADRVADVDPYIYAGMAAGVTDPLRRLLKASVDRQDGVPSWMTPALAGPLRPLAIEAALTLGPNAAAAMDAVTQLGEGDTWLIMGVLIDRGRAGHDEVSRALLTHPVEVVRGTASLWFGFDVKDHAEALPPGWEGDWSAAFEVAPIERGRVGDDYRLGEHIKRLAKSDPDLVERWVSRQLATDPSRIVFRLGGRGEIPLAELPRIHRERIVRAHGTGLRAQFVVEMLIGEDVEWAAQLVRDGVISLEVLRVALSNGWHDGGAARVLRLAPALLEAGLTAEDAAMLAEPSGWIGSPAAAHAKVAEEYEAAGANEDAGAEAVRRAGMRIFRKAQEREAVDERRERIKGEW